jgi:hypothetical protein
MRISFRPVLIHGFADFVSRYQDSTGQGWHKSKSGKWVKDSSDDSKKWKKGSDGKWTSYEEGKH